MDLFVLVFSLMLIAANGLPTLLLANRYNICTIQVLTGYSNPVLIISGLEDAASLDFIYEDRTVYWTDVSQERIKSAHLNQGSLNVVDVVSTGLISPDGLACDWVTKKLYWVDSETNRIEACNLDGSMRRVLFWRDLDQPRAIVLDPIRGYFYWTDWGETAKIERASMDGLLISRQSVINTDIFWPNGLTLDYNKARMFWTDARLHYIHSANLDGSDRHIVVADSLPHPFAITIYEDALYWTDWQMKAVYSCNMSDGRSINLITDKLYSPMGIHAFESLRQPKSKNPCAEDNGGCSHFCFLSPWFPFYSCQCPTGVRLLDDNRTCDNGPSEMLLLARRMDIRLISLDISDFLDVVLDIQNIRHAIALDYDPVEKRIYWTDDDLHSIHRAFLNGSGLETVVDVEIYSPDGIAVDWLSRNLYWTDTGSDLIQVTRLDGSSRKVIISDGLDEPRAVVLDPFRGCMYWTDWGKQSKIERSNLDGSDRLVLVNVSLGWPNGLAIDRVEGKLYWADAKLDRIEYINLDGSGRRILVAEHIPHIFGFTLLGDYVYWTDWQRRAIERVNKRSGKQRMVIIDQLPDIMGLTAVAAIYPTGNGGCSIDNGGCSHLCFSSPQGPICACPFGMELLKSSRKTCTSPEALILYTKQSEIHVASLENVDNDIIIPLHDLKTISDIDYDFADNRIYWADTGHKMISRAFLNGSLIQPVIRYGLELPDCLAIDWLAHNLYWSDSGTGRIEMSRLNGTSRRVLLWKDVKPRDLILDPNNGFMYWMNTANFARIERAALDGTQRQIIVTDVENVNSLTLDYSKQRLYWINLDSSRIESSTIDGRSRYDVVVGLQQPYSLTIYGDFIYWTDWQTGSIQRANKTNGLDQSLVLNEIRLPMDLAIFHLSRQLGWSPCGMQNGGCSHLCITNTRWTEVSQYSSHCLCSTHHTLSMNNRTCSSPNLLILVSQKNSIIQLSLGSDSDFPDVPLALPPQFMRGIRTFDFDPYDDTIYWVDGKTKTIRKMKSDGSYMVILLQSSGQSSDSIVPFDVVVDFSEGLVYWTDSVRNVISVLRADGSDVGIILNDTDQHPRTLALAHEVRLLFWTNLAHSSQSIACSEMDGSEYRDVFVGNFGILGPITIDAQAKRIYWSDLGLGQIESGDFDGTNRKVILKAVSQPVALAIHEDLLFWADKELKAIEMVNKYTGHDRQTLKSRLPLLNDLIIVKRQNHTKAAKSRCLKSNLKCSHICISQIDGLSRCSCPIGLILDADGQRCVLSLPCGVSQISCSSGTNPCIPIAWKCDGERDCKDGSDEASCFHTCSPSEFKCHNDSGGCIPLDLHCNGHKNCSDGSDEEVCFPCIESTTDCRHMGRTCFTSSQRCDGIVNCWDGVDEMNCVQIAKEGSGVHYTMIVIGIICGILLILIIIAVVYLCRRKNIYCIKMYGKSSPKTLSTMPAKCPQVCNQVSSANSSQLQKQQQKHFQQRDATLSSGHYDELFCDPFVDASTLSSFLSHYPRETLNPPPTPITSDTSTGNILSSESLSTLKLTKRNQKRHRFALAPPPTTPCSTDVCDNSEPYSADERHRFFSLTDASFETELLCPPPPSPCSQFFSEGYSLTCTPLSSNVPSHSSESSVIMF